KINVPVLAATDEERRACRGTRHEQRPRGSKIEIARLDTSLAHAIQQTLITWREEVLHDQRSAFELQLDEAVPEVRPPARRVETAIPGHDIDMARSISGRSRPSLPDAAVLRGRSGIPDGFLLQRRRVIGEQPAVQRAVGFVIRREADVENAA